MSTDETTNGTNEVFDNVSAESTSEADAAPAPKPGWNRRTFLKAAALGAAAATFIKQDSGGNWGLGVSSALADVVTNVNCTANDVRIIGPGIIINEPCDCPDGKFNAQVKFRLNNNTGTDRYCVTVHLCAATSSSGIAFPAQDIVIGTVGPGTHDLIATINDYPCGAGKVCFGEAGSGEDGGFAKGETCPTGKCCTVISWNVRPNDPCPLPHENIIKSKCRAQQVCIVGRGTTTLDCNTSASGVQSTCAVACGGTATLRLCTTNDASYGPFTFTLGTQSHGPTLDTCHDFTVGPLTAASTSFTGTVTDASGCAKSASVTLTTTPIEVTSASGTPPACAGGNTTLKACASGGGEVTYAFSEGTTSLGSVKSSTGCGELSVALGSGTHTIKVVATNAGGCTDEETFEVTVPTPVKADLSLSADQPCSGAVSFTATVTGGTAPYTIKFSVDGVSKQTGTGTTFSYGPVLDGTCHKISVSATDSASCPSTPTAADGDTISVSQCVKTTVCP